MSPTVPKNKNKHQIRTEETQAKILDAAEAASRRLSIEAIHIVDALRRPGAP